MHYISEFIRAATVEIYSSMVSLSVTPVEADDTVLTPVKAGGITVCIEFTGALQANLYMTYDEALAKNVTFTMMGSMPPSVSSPEVADVLGELANMIGGIFKAKMAAKGLAGQASAPKIGPSSELSPTPIPGGISLMNRLTVPVAASELEIRVFAKV